MSKYESERARERLNSLESIRETKTYRVINNIRETDRDYSLLLQILIVFI